MSNIVSRILSNAVLFALFMSVSLTLHASPKNTQLDSSIVTPHFIACDTPDQTNPDIDFDSHAYVISLRALQPLPKAPYSYYQSTILDKPFSCAHQRGPPSYLI